MSQILKLDFNERADGAEMSVSAKDFQRNLWRYPDRENLERTIAAHYKLNDTQVLCTNGGDEAIMLLMRIVKEKSELILPLPAFSQYLSGLESWSLKCSLIPAQAGGYQINFDALLQATLVKKNTAIVITRPNNPSGELITEQALVELLKIAKQNHSWIFLDEAYIEFSSAPERAVELLNQFDNLVILRTFSKAYGLAGIRVGYLMGNSTFIEMFRRRCLPFNLSSMSIQLALSALKKENVDAVKKYCQQIRENRQTIYRWLTTYGFSVSQSDANFLLIEFASAQAQATASFLLKNNIQVRRFTEPQLKDCLRITIPLNIDALFTRLKQCLKPTLICLDMDGVLLDTGKSYDQCVRQTVIYFSDQQISKETLVSTRQRGGLNNDWQLTQALLKDLGFEISLDQIIPVFQRLYLGESNHMEAQPGLYRNEKRLIKNSMLNTINRIKDCQFAVVTGRPKAEAIVGLQRVPIKNIALVSLDDVQEAKPSPEGIEKLQKEFSVASWMCGDNPDDMQAAVASNSLAIGIGQANATALYQAGADIVLENVNQLESWLCQMK